VRRVPKRPQPPLARPVLAIDSSWDQETTTASTYRKNHVYPYLVEQELQVTNLRDINAVRAKFASEAPKAGVRFITGAGHGTSESFTGNLGEVILRVGEYGAAEVADKIVHLMSCSSASELGPDIIAKGATAFFGYSAPLVIQEGRQDTLYECDSEIDRRIADRLRVAEVHDHVVALFETHIDRWAAEDPRAATYLTDCLQCLRTPVNDGRLGDVNARLAD
jgi:hypothetical protein